MNTSDVQIIEGNDSDNESEDQDNLNNQINNNEQININDQNFNNNEEQINEENIMNVEINQEDNKENNKKEIGKIFVPIFSQNTQEKNACPICLDNWTGEGIHRVCALKCGHIFGRSCIEKWLKSRLKNQNSCPQCNTKARRADIINLYITNLTAVDNSLLEQLKNDIQKEKKVKNEIDRSLQHITLKYNMLQTENDILKNENINLKRKLSLMTDGKIESVENLMSSIKYTDMKNFKICKQNGCRIMTVHPSDRLVLISKVSENQNLFPGYGICKFNMDMIDCKNYTTEYVRLHKNRIRDLELSPYDTSNLLSCSLDRSIRITNLQSNVCVQEYLNPNPIWSCMWDPDNSTVIYAGLANGSIVAYDTRNTSDIMTRIELNKSNESQIHGSPVVSVKPLYVKTNSPNRIFGIIAATFDNVYFIEKEGDQHKTHEIIQPVGRIVSVDTDRAHECFVISQRPRGDLKNCQRLVGEIQNICDENVNKYKFNLIASLDGGTSHSLLNRSTLYSPTNDDNMYVGFGNEDKCAIQIYHVGNKRSSLIPSKYGHIVDLAPIWFQDWHYLLGLTESSITLYRYVA